MNYVTNILGVLLIIAASYTSVIKDVSWMDAQFGIYAGIGLIYTKNSSLISSLKEIVKKGEVVNKG